MAIFRRFNVGNIKGIMIFRLPKHQNTFVPKHQTISKKEDKK